MYLFVEIFDAKHMIKGLTKTHILLFCYAITLNILFKVNIEQLNRNYDQNNIENAIRTQHAQTYGDFRSPIRAAFQNVPSALE